MFSAVEALKKEENRRENCMSEKENKNTEPVFKITSMVSIKYVNQLAGSHCELATLSSRDWQQSNVKECIEWKKILIYKKFSGLTKPEE